MMSNHLLLKNHIDEYVNVGNIDLTITVDIAQVTAQAIHNATRNGVDCACRRAMGFAIVWRDMVRAKQSTLFEGPGGGFFWGNGWRE